MAGATYAPPITQQSLTMPPANTSTSTPSTASTLHKAPNIKLEHSSPLNPDINQSDDDEALAIIGTGFNAKTVYNDAI